MTITNTAKENKKNKIAFMKKIPGFVWSGIYVLFFTILALIIFTVVFFQNDNYYLKKDFVFPNILLLIFAILFYVGLYILLKKSKLHIFSKKGYTAINVLSVFLFICLIYIAFNVFFYPGWDAGHVHNDALSISETMFTDNPIGFDDGKYYSFYSNQQLLLLTESVLLKINNSFGITNGDNGLIILIAVQCFLMVLTGNLLYRIIHKKTNSNKVAIIGYSIFFILLAMSGWAYVPYTDGMAICTPILIYYIYIKKDEVGKHKLLWWALIGVLSYWGYKMKPTVIIMLISILVTEFVYGLLKDGRYCLKDMLKGGAVLLLSFVVSSQVFAGAFKLTRVEIDNNYNTGPLHMLMMGLNNQTDGVWYKDDVLLSQGYGDDANGRKVAQKEKISERLKEYGFVGLLDHLKKKTLVIFNDGTYAWGNEGSFYNLYTENRNSSASPRLRDLFYDTGKKYKILSVVKQATWLFVMLACLLSVFLKKDKHLAILIVSIIGIILFNLLFEARARYLLIYIPIFIVVASISLQQIGDTIINMTQKLRKQKQGAQGAL